jgi:hypothetical protein
VTRSTEITGEERDALYDQILSHLSSLDDLRMALEAEDYDRAERLGVEFGDDFRLLEDLGWGPPTSCTVQLTMSPEQLHRVFTRLHSDAEGLRQDEEREKAEIENETRDQRQRATRITEACNRVLSAVGRIPSRGGAAISPDGVGRVTS